MKERHLLRAALVSVEGAVGEVGLMSFLECLPSVEGAELKTVIGSLPSKYFPS